MNAHDFWAFCKEKDTSAEGKYGGAFLPQNWEEDENKASKEQKRFVFEYKRAIEVIDAELPALKEAGHLKEGTDEVAILKRAWTQFARKSGIRADPPHLRPNLFNAFIKEGAPKFKEPTIINAGSGKGGSKTKITLTDGENAEIFAVLGEGLQRAKASGDFDEEDLNVVKGEVVAKFTALKGSAPAEENPLVAEFEAVETALQNALESGAIKEGAVLDGIGDALAKLRKKLIKEGAQTPAPSFNAIRKVWSSDCEKKFCGLECLAE